MAFPLSPQELETELKSLFGSGLSGHAKDFSSWVKMETFRKFREEPSIDEEQIATILTTWLSKCDIMSNPYDSREVVVSPTSSFQKKPTTSESYTILGALKYSPMQYVRSRLEYFLERNNVSEEERLDISIATVEAVENSAKYGDGGNIDVSYSITRDRQFNISILNTVKDFNLEDDIQRGKFSSTATLMRGMMVMQKLFDAVDLDILENRSQAFFKASKKLSS